MKRLFYSFTLLFVFTSCSSAQKHLSAIDLALTEIQRGRLGEGRDKLEHLCMEGATAACALNGHPGKGERPLPILQSVSSNAQVRFVVVVPRSKSFRYYVRSPGGIRTASAERLERKDSESAVDQIEAFDLEPTTTYELIVLGSDGVIWDRRSFHSLNLDKKRGRFAVTSCMDESLTERQGRIWPQLVSQKPDVIIMIGENLHRDKASGEITPEQLWHGYVETRERLPIFTTNPLIPVIAVWDDHDYGKNDGDRTYAYRAESSDIFFSFFAQRKPAPGYERGPGISGWWNAFGVHFAFLDDRSFRSPNGVDLPDQTHFGSEQETWLRDHLTAAKETAFLVSGDLFFGQTDSFEVAHPKRFKDQLAEWRKVKEPLLFVSGDRHIDEILKVPTERLGYPTFELTSSVKRSPGQYNYVIVELIRSDRNFIQLEAQAFGPDQKQLFQKTLTVKR